MQTNSLKKKKATQAQKTMDFGVPLQLSSLRTWRCHCSSWGPCCGVGLIPGSRAFPCHGQKKKKKKQKTYEFYCNNANENYFA